MLPSSLRAVRGRSGVSQGRRGETSYDLLESAPTGLATARSPPQGRLRREVRDQRVHRQRSAGGALDELPGGVEAAESVDPIAQEGEERLRVSRSEGFVESGRLSIEPLHQLRADRVADRVGREESDHALRPVAVLETAG